MPRFTRTWPGCFVFTLATVMQAAHAADVAWINPAGGDWSVAGNWGGTSCPG